MNLFAQDQDDTYLWFIFGRASAIYPWGSIFGGGGVFANQWLTISQAPRPASGEIAQINLTSQTPYTDPRDADRVTFNISGSHSIQIKDAEYIDGVLDKATSLFLYNHHGFTTDGSIDRIRANIGNQEIFYTTAVKDSSLSLGAGWDQVHLGDQLDIPGTQYWSVIRRDANQIDAYSLLTGRRVRLEEGAESRNADQWGNRNYGEVEDLFLADARNGGTVKFAPGKTSYIPNGSEIGVQTNIDLRSDGQTFSDSFNLAYFNFIRYTSDNVWVGEATIHDGTIYSTPSDRTVSTAKYGVNAPVLDGLLSVIGQSRNGTHDLIIGEQDDAIDGQLRVYAFNVQSKLYNEFNEVYLGTSTVDFVDKSGITTNRPSDRVALYGFGDNDILIGGAGRDYLFGGQSVYNQLLGSAGIGNKVTGGVGADYFGVGNTNTAGVVTGNNDTIAPSWGAFHQGYATDVIMDWHSGQDTLVVLSNGVAVIGGLRLSTDPSVPVVSLSGITSSGNNTIDLRDSVAIATSDQDFDGARGGGTGGEVGQWDATRDLDFIFNNQTARDAQSITNETDRSVVNQGLIVARGLDGADTLFGSSGNDYIYGNKAKNIIEIGNGGNDRVYVDQFDGSRAKHFVSGFTKSNGVVNDRDLVMLNKGVIDAFYSGGASRVYIKQDITGGTYTQGVNYATGLNYLHDVFYNPSYSATNATHTQDDGAAFWEGTNNADGKSSLSGLGMAIAGRAMFAIPFVGPIIGAAMLVAATPIFGLGFKLSETQAHQNATYNKFVGNYLNVISRAEVGNSVASQVGTDNSGVRFLDFFPGSVTSDGYLPVVEFTAHAGQGIYGFFALHSNVETFVFLVASSDNMVENGEAILVAEINGNLSANDFGVYDGELDIYNYGVQPEVVIRTPTVTSVADSATPTADEGLTDGLIAAAQNPIVIKGSVSGALASGSYFRVFDGATKIYDGDTPVANPLVTLSMPTATSFTFTDSRPLGTTVRNTTNNDPTGSNTTGDDTFVLTDARVVYTVELIDGETGIPTRVSARVVEVAGGNGIIDGDDGTDTLLLTKTSSYLNSFANNLATADNRFIGMEKVLLAPEPVPAASVTISGGAVTAISFSGVSFTGVPDGTYVLDIVNEDVGGVIGTGAVATATVTGGSVTAVTITNGGSGYTSATQALLSGAGIEVILTGQSESIEVFGSTATDRIVGGEGNDSLFGVGGNDTILGGAGNDAIDGGPGADSINGGTGNDVIVYASQTALSDDATVIGGDGTDTIRMDTTTAALTLVSSDFSNVTQVEVLALNGTGTQDVTLGTETNTAFATGITVTTLSAATSLHLKGALSTVTVHATGTLNADTLIGGAGNDTLIGGAGNDTIAGGAGVNSLLGGAGDDTFVYSNDADLRDDTINGEGGSSDVIRLDAGGLYRFDLATVTNVEKIALNGDALFDLVFALGVSYQTTDPTNATGVIEIVNTTGSAISQRAFIFAGFSPNMALNVSATDLDGGNEIFGGAGNDTVYGGAGDDDIYGLSGDDLIIAGSGNDTITAGNGQDNLSGGDGSDFFALSTYLTSADTISGGDGGTNIDTLTFTDANGAADDLNNVTGIETITLGNTTTTVVVTTVNALVANAATLTVNGSSLTTGTMTWNGAAETDGKFHITGGDAADTIIAGAGNDTILGGTGNDIITGRGGLDSLDGGAGNDVFLFASASELADDVTVIGGSETDTIRMDTGSTALTLADADFADVIQVENLDLTGTAAQTVTLGAQTNEAFSSGITITTNATAASLNLQGSASTVSINATGTNNADTLVGGSANDTLDAGSGGGSVSGGDGADTIYWSGAGNTTIVGGDGDDFVDPETGQTGADSIAGGAGNDTIYGGGGDDTILGGTGNDDLIGEDGSNVLWGGQGADTISANNGAIDTVIMVGDLSTADATKLADVNATLDVLMGYNYPDVDTGYVSDVDPSDAIAFDTTSGVTDVLYTFGTVDLSGLNIQGSYSIVAHSKITLTESQLNAATSITFVGASSHEIVVVNNDLSAIDGMDQQVVVENWADRDGQQLKFEKASASDFSSGFSVGGKSYVSVANPVSRLLRDESFETPTRSVLSSGSPFAASEGMSLRWDDQSDGFIATFESFGDDKITEAGRTESKAVGALDLFGGVRFLSYFEPGYTQLPIPSTFGSFGDNAVHREQFEVFYGNYDNINKIFYVYESPEFSPPSFLSATRSTYTLIIYDDDPSNLVADVEGIVMPNLLPERSGWQVLDPGTSNARLEFNNSNLDVSLGYNFEYGTLGSDALLDGSSDIDYIYGLDGDDYLVSYVEGGAEGDFLFAGSGADTIVAGPGSNIIDVGYDTQNWTIGDDDEDVVILNNRTTNLVDLNRNRLGEDLIYNFEFDIDIVRVVASGIAEFSHLEDANFGTATLTTLASSERSVAIFSQDTLVVDLDGDGQIETDEVAVTFKDYDQPLSKSRIQYDLLGTSGNDFIVGGGLNDTIRGDGGDDTLTGGAGADSLSGGNGNDLFLFATVSDVLEDVTIRGDSGTDTIRIASQITTAVNLGTQASITSVERLELVGGSTVYVTPDSTMTQIVLGAAGLVQMSATDQAVTGSAGNDTVKVITGVSSSSDLMGGTNTVVVTDGANISAGTFTATGGTVGYDLDLARTTTMTIAQNALITSAAGSNIVTLSDASDTNGISSVEAYILAGGDQRFTLASARQDVTTGSGHVVIDTGPTLTAFVATYDYFDNGLGWQRNVTSPEFASEADALQFVVDQKQMSHHPDPILKYTTQVQPTMDAVINGTAATSLSINLGSDVDLSTAVITGVNGNQDADYTITIDENINATMTVAQNALITSAGGFNIVTLSNAGIATGFGGVEGYVLADGVNTFTMVAGNKTVTGGTGDDIVEGSSMADSITLGGGDDIVVISAATDSAFETYEGGDHVNGDTVRVTGTGNVDLSNDMITEFEKMDLGTDTGAQRVTMSIDQRIALSDISAIAQDVVTVKGVFDNSLDYTALAQGNATIILDDSDNSVTIDVTDADNMRTGGAKFASNDTVTIAATEAELATVFATPANYGLTALGGAGILLNDTADNSITINTDQFTALVAQGIKFAPTEDIILTGVYGTATDWSLWTTTQIGGNSVTLDDSDDLVTIDRSDLAAMNSYGQTFVSGDDVTLTTGSTTDISSILWIDNLTASSNNIDLTGNSGANVLIGNNGFNQLAGGVGNDTLTGGGGKDTLLGGDGDDTLVVNGTADIAAGEIYDGGNDNGDVLSVTATTNFSGVQSITNIETILLADDVATTFDAQTLSGQTMQIVGTGDNGGESLTVNGTALSNIIDLSGITVDGNDITGAVINGLDGNDTITGTNGVDTIVGGLGSDVFVYTTNAQTTTGSTIAQMDVIEGFNVIEDSFDLSALGTISGLTAVVDGSDTDSYVVSWTSGGVTNSVYVKDTGVTGGLTLTDNGSGVITATGSELLGLTLISVSEAGITTQGDGPHRAYFTQGDTAPIRNDASTYFTQSTNVGASTDYSFSQADIAASDAAVRVGQVAIQSTNSGANTYLDARVYIGGATDTDDTIVADITGGRTVLNYAIIYAQGGNDTVIGSTGNDYIFGGAGNDVIDGGAGNDRLFGGLGADKFLYTSGQDGTDTITDFTSGVDTYETSFVTTNTSSAELALSASNIAGGDGNVSFQFDVSNYELLTYAFDFSVDRDSGASLFETVEDPLNDIDLMQALETQLVLDDGGTISGATNGSFSSITADTNFLIQITNTANGNSYLIEASNTTDTTLRGYAPKEFSLVAVFENATLTAADITSADYVPLVSSYALNTVDARNFETSTVPVGTRLEFVDAVDGSTLSFASEASGTITFNLTDASLVNKAGFLRAVSADSSVSQPVESGVYWLVGSDSANSLDAQVALASVTGNGTLTKAVIVGLNSNDTIAGLNVDDEIYSGNGNDVIDAGNGDDFINAGGGDDWVTLLLDGNDTVDGGGNLDTLSLAFGTYDVTDLRNVTGFENVEFVGATGTPTSFTVPNSLTLGSDDGNVIIFSVAQANTAGILIDASAVVTGFIEIDANSSGLSATVSNMSGNDTIIGSQNDDYLAAGAGDDIFIGGLGDDVFFGGSGRDTFALESGSIDEIKDFNVVDDFIDFSSLTSAAWGFDTNGQSFDSTPTFVNATNKVVQLWAGGSTSSTADVNSASDIAAAFSTNLYAIDSNGKSIVIGGRNDAAANGYVWLVDSAADGDGASVTQADVELIGLMRNVEIDNFTSSNFIFTQNDVVAFSNTSGDISVVGGSDFGEDTPYRTITDFQSSAGDKIEMIGFSFEPGRGNATSVVSTLGNNAAIDSTSTILQVSDSSYGASNAIQNFTTGLESAFDLSSLDDQDHMIAIFAASDIDGDVDTKQSWVVLYRNETVDDNADPFNFQIIGLVSQANSDVTLDHTNFVFY